MIIRYLLSRKTRNLQIHGATPQRAIRPHQPRIAPSGSCGTRIALIPNCGPIFKIKSNTVGCKCM
ncbi:hypothetical protein CCP2SC5_1410007 [Azospirillaceae bacterium]